MPTLQPIARALVPADSPAADALGAPNYDEFQSDLEVWELLRKRPASVLNVTMPHCAVEDAAAIGTDGADDALAAAAKNMARLSADPRVRELRNLMWVYEITRPEAPGKPQTGLGGMARVQEIRTDANPAGTIVRNEGIREAKALARARLTQATSIDMGTVNLAVDDSSGALQSALERYAGAQPPAFETTDETGNHHRVWLLQDAAEQGVLRGLAQAEPLAYVADGNHRSAAAAMLGYRHFLAVFFPARTMTIAPYNRLIKAGAPIADLAAQLERRFHIDAPPPGPYQPHATHDIGLYDGSTWRRLRPRKGTFDPRDAAQDIDADIVQRLLFSELFGLHDARDPHITYVGANRDARWLQAEVDAGRFRYAVTLPAVTMAQFIRVCRENKLMPPKSTWFVPKIRSGLVMAAAE
jgi:uncharacterized protein (DUF1015 family)